MTDNNFNDWEDNNKEDENLSNSDSNINDEYYNEVNSNLYNENQNDTQNNNNFNNPNQNSGNSDMNNVNYRYSNDGNRNNVPYYYGDPMLNHPEIRKFNWSAFSDSIFWGIGNKCYITLLTLIPFFGIVWMFVCGFKGNQWVWENGEYKTIEEFKMVQDTWNRAGLARFIYNIIIRFFIFFLVYLLIFFFIGVMAGMEEYWYESYWY